MRVSAVGMSGGADATARVVDAKRTPVSMSDIRAALARALETATGRPASGATVDVLAAQVSLETAHGGAMYNFNFGGIKGVSPEGETARYMTHEVDQGRTVTLEQGFRAYESIDQGARDYVAVLKNRFPAAFAQAASGNVDGFAHALKQSHYFTASEADYAAGLRSAVGAGNGGSSALALRAPATVTGASDFSTTEELSRVLDAVAASAARIAAPDPVT